MDDLLRERLIASFAGAGPAMVAQNVLEAGGVPCRVGDLGHIPQHLLGVAGGLNRPVGLWVLELDAERATALLATMAETSKGVDEEALAAEALAAAPEAGGELRSQPAGASARGRSAPARERRLPSLATVMIVSIVAVVVLLGSRGCA